VPVLWFRRDLRLRDNPALHEAAAAGGDVVPLFVLDDALWGPAGRNRRAFLVGCLRALDESLDGRLVVRRGDPARVVAEVADGGPVFAAEDFGPYGVRRDEAVLDAGVDLRLVGSPYAVPPGEVTSGAGTPYKVFTPFSKAWRQHGWPPPLPAPRSMRWAALGGAAIPDAPGVDAALPDAGEEAARRAARRFWDRGLAGYADGRNRPDLDGSSRLSPYLRWGCLHPRQLLAKLGRSASESVFRTELCWREFYADVLFHDPASSRRSWSASMRSMRVDHGTRADARFAAWAAGETGYPLVDAGMRQLVAEGWMHNRVRMLVASFLVKDLHVDWTRGARHFMQHLVDGDLASNAHGWQWVAGTGTDASPFVRVFNPVTQSKRFDPSGDYIRRYVVELRDVEAPAIHEPWKLADPPRGYAAPIVEHDVERLEALRRFEERAGR
jgi:deoxyribodipyrimidine photo-lyase